MKSASDIVLKLLGLLLLTAAVLKGWQLLIEPMANKDIWTNRAFLIFIVEFEIALGIWLLSGLFKKAAWLTALACFTLFSFITLYKGLGGAESCGCFGSVHVNPWITLFAIDIPAVVALIAFRLENERFFSWPSISRFASVGCLCLVTLGATGYILGFNEPEKITASYEVLEPNTWVGKKIPILSYINNGKSLRKDIWAVLFYHYDCPDCAEAIPKYERMSQELAESGDCLRIALIEVPPYGDTVFNSNSPCTLSRLVDKKEWFITTPTVLLLENSIVRDAWEGKAPDVFVILRSFSTLTECQPNSEETRKEVVPASTLYIKNI